jgi:hypothetical protein
LYSDVVENQLSVAPCCLHCEMDWSEVKWSEVPSYFITTRRHNPKDHALNFIAVKTSYLALSFISSSYLLHYPPRFHSFFLHSSSFFSALARIIVRSVSEWIP